MKLQTSIKPRRDGTVKVIGQDRQTYVFVADEDGLLSGEVPDAATVAELIKSENFWPLSDEDNERALAMVGGGQSGVPAAGGQTGEPDDDESDTDGDEADGPGMNALPVEANTPPVRRKPGPKPKAA